MVTISQRVQIAGQRGCWPIAGSAPARREATFETAWLCWCLYFGSLRVPELRA